MRPPALYLVVPAGAAPVGLLAALGDALLVLTVVGVVSASQAPFFALLTLWVNRRFLPEELRPGWLSSAGLLLAGLFFAAASTLYLLGLAGIKPLSGGS